MKKEIIRFNEAMKTAKAIYVVSGLKEMITYLDAKKSLGEITKEDSDEIIDLVTALYENADIYELAEIRNKF